MVSASNNTVMEAALRYLEIGCSVIAVGYDKKPLRPWREFQERRPTEEEVRQWFAADDCGVAIITGPISGGLVVRDFDANGSYALWSAQHPDLARTLPTVRTGRPGGHHVYFRASSEALDEVRQILGKGCHGAAPIGDGELKVGSGSYVVAPPSRHLSGTFYRWVVPLGDSVPMIDPQAVGLTASWSDGSGTAVTATHRSDTEDGCGLCTLVSSTSSVSIPSVARDEQIRRAVLATLPQTTGKKRHAAIFDLVRTLRAVPHLADRPATVFKPIVRQWHSLALPCINDKAFETTWSDFLDGWERVRFPKGDGPFDQVLCEAVSAEPPACAMEYDAPELRLLVSLTRGLQRKAGDKPFPLSCRKAGSAVGIDYRIANRWLRLLVQDGVLERAVKGNRPKRLADQYRYLPA